MVREMENLEPLDWLTENADNCTSIKYVFLRIIRWVTCLALSLTGTD